MLRLMLYLGRVDILTVLFVEEFGEVQAGVVDFFGDVVLGVEFLEAKIEFLLLHLTIPPVDRAVELVDVLDWVDLHFPLDVTRHLDFGLLEIETGFVLEEGNRDDRAVVVIVGDTEGVVLAQKLPDVYVLPVHFIGWERASRV